MAKVMRQNVNQIAKVLTPKDPESRNVSEVNKDLLTWFGVPELVVSGAHARG